MIKGLNSLPDYQVSSSGIKQEDVQNTLAKSKQAVTDNFESNSAIKTAAGNTTDPSVMRNTMLLLPPLIIVNRFIDKLMGGAEEKSILTKAATLGDKIAQTLHLDKVFSDENTSRFAKFIKNNRFTKYFTNEYKAIPKNSFAKGSTLTEKYSQELISGLTEMKYNKNFSRLFQTGADKLSADSLKVLEGLGPLKTGVTPEYLTSVQKCLSEIATRTTDVDDWKVISALQEKITTFMQKDAAGKAKASTKGLADDIAAVLKKFNASKYNFGIPASKPLSSESLKVLSSVTSEAQSAVPIATDKLISTVDDIMSKGIDTVKKGTITSDPVDLSILKNKLKASDLQIGKTGIGKLFAKSGVKTKDLITYGGGLFSLIFTANALVQTIKATKEAPKGEKKSTFMHVLSEQYIGLLLFQPSINLLYKAGGNKYRGMTTEGRAALKELVQRTNANKNLTKEGFKIARLQKDLLLKGVDKDKVATLAGKTLAEAKNLAKGLKKEGTKIKFWEKPLKAAGKLLDTGLDSLKSPTRLGKIGGKLKGFAGGLGRLLIIMMVIQPFIQKPITKLCHKIFGEPKTYLAKNGQDTDKTDKKKQNTNTQAETANTQSQLTAVNPEETNLLKRYQKQETPAATQTQAQTSNQTQTQSAASPISAENQQQQQNNDEMAALNLFNKDKQTSSSQRYIPSIQVDSSYEDDKQKELEKQVNEILKSTDATLKRVKSSL